ncbi:MAG: hypothetical protein II723_07745 [Oscillospiraceae bacterium]|nr:hypothetical protein [Oscillospiraceae bacterium]
MKSLFKRVLATATGYVLLVSQLAATGININAADSASGTVLDKAWLTAVPVDEATIPAIDALPVVIEGEDAAAAGSVQWGESVWNDDLETAMNTVLGDKDSVSASFFGAKARELVIRNLARTSYLTRAEATEFVNGFSNADVKVTSAGKLIAEMSVDGVNERVGSVAEDALTRRGIKFVNEDGDPVVLDWNKFPMSGTVTVEVDYSKFDKTASYNVVFTDGKKTYDGYDEFAQYVTEEFNAAVDFIADEATAQNAPKLAEDIQYYRGRYETLKGEVESVVDTINKIQIEGDDPDQVYADYKQAVYDAIGDAETSVRFAKRARAEMYRLPETFMGALTGDRGQAWIDYVIDAAKRIAGDKVKVTLSASDIAHIVDEGYDYKITIPNGFSADAEFKLAEEEADQQEVFDAIEKAYGDQWAEDGYELVSVTSHKEVTLNAETDKLTDSEKLYYNVVRIIDEVLLKKVEETTTTTEETTESTTSSETTTESTTTSETTTESTTTSETTTESTTTSETTTESTTSSETTTESTTSESTTSESTTTELTSIDSSEPTETTSESTTSESTTSESTTYESTTSESTTTEITTTSESTTADETAPVTDEKGNTYELSFDAEGLSEELVYWSEETEKFDFDNLEVKMNINVIAADGTSSVKTIDVTDAFAPDKKSPQDFEFKGFGNYNIQIALQDADAVETALKAEIDDETVVARLVKKYKVANGKLADTNGVLPVILVLRGDFDLDNTVTAFDATCALTFFNQLRNTGYSLDDILSYEDEPSFKALPASMQAVGKYAHYAADVNGDGMLFASDAMDILTYFNWRYNSGWDDVDWTDADLVGETTVLEKLHSDPFAFEKKD